jgi:hypothetical protein
VGAHGFFGRTWGSRQAQHVPRPGSETVALGQNAEVLAGRSKGFVLADPLGVAEQPSQPGLAFDFKDVNRTSC